MANETRYEPYADGTKTDHHMDGVVVPKSTARGYWDTRLPNVRNDSVGTPFDIQKPMAQNFVEIGADGVTRMVKMSQEEVMRLADANRVNGKDAKSDHPPVAVTLDHILPPLQASAQAPVQTAFSAAVAPSAAVPVVTPLASSVPQPVPQTISERLASVSSPPPPAPARPRQRVQFVGDFGAIAYHYDTVHVHGYCLVLVQHSPMKEFFEAPSGEHGVTVNVGAAKYVCYPGPQFPLIPHGDTFVTVYLIDEDATSQLNGQRSEDGKA
jgi:hypothetical protein